MTPEEKKQANKKYLKDMAEWGRDTGEWILNHPDLNWLEEYNKAYGSEVSTLDEGGDRPPIKPPNP